MFSPSANPIASWGYLCSLVFKVKAQVKLNGRISALILIYYNKAIVIPKTKGHKTNPLSNWYVIVIFCSPRLLAVFILKKQGTTEPFLCKKLLFYSNQSESHILRNLLIALLTSSNFFSQSAKSDQPVKLVYTYVPRRNGSS